MVSEMDIDNLLEKKIDVLSNEEFDVLCEKLKINLTG